MPDCLSDLEEPVGLGGGRCGNETPAHIPSSAPASTSCSIGLMNSDMGGRILGLCCAGEAGE